LLIRRIKYFPCYHRNGAGDFTFSGGDGGTRVNQQGYIEQTPANLLSYSEDFTVGTWLKHDTLLTSKWIM
jgi:hypothetical protein